MSQILARQNRKKKEKFQSRKAEFEKKQSNQLIPKEHETKEAAEAITVTAPVIRAPKHHSRTGTLRNHRNKTYSKPVLLAANGEEPDESDPKLWKRPIRETNNTEQSDESDSENSSNSDDFDRAQFIKMTTNKATNPITFESVETGIIQGQSIQLQNDVKEVASSVDNDHAAAEVDELEDLLNLTVSKPITTASGFRTSCFSHPATKSTLSAAELSVRAQIEAELDQLLGL